jgi:hypothetical protein
MFAIARPCCHSPTRSAGLVPYRNGLPQEAGLDCALAGSTVTFLAGSVPQPGDSRQASYRVGQ